jgi:hypothetical protein
MRLLSVFAAVAFAVVSLGAQSLPVFPTWKNLETWSRFNATANETEIGLGLHSGGSGPLSVAFTATFPGKSPRPPAAGIVVKVALSPSFNPNVVPDPRVTFILDEGLPKLTVLDISASFLGNEVIPTTNLRTGVARMTPAEYQRLTRARGVKATILGATMEFSKVQLDAMRAYGKKVVPVAK